jgi:hypothetical protein
MTKQHCNAQAAEVLFSHNPSDSTSSVDMKSRTNPNLNIQLLCEQNGGGRAQYDESSTHSWQYICRTNPSIDQCFGLHL